MTSSWRISSLTLDYITSRDLDLRLRYITWPWITVYHATKGNTTQTVTDHLLSQGFEPHLLVLHDVRKDTFCLTAMRNFSWAYKREAKPYTKSLKAGVIPYPKLSFWSLNCKLITSLRTLTCCRLPLTEGARVLNHVGVSIVISLRTSFLAKPYILNITFFLAVSIYFSCSLMLSIQCNQLEKIINKHNTELQRTAPGQHIRRSG